MAWGMTHKFDLLVPKRSGAEGARIETDELDMYVERIFDTSIFTLTRAGGNRWVAFSVDVKKQTFKYGEFA